MEPGLETLEEMAPMEPGLEALEELDLLSVS